MKVTEISANIKKYLDKYYCLLLVVHNPTRWKKIEEITLKFINIVQTVIIVFVTTLVILVVLWKMNVLHLNVSEVPQLERGKEVLQVDELSQLLKLDYPTLGEDMDQAFAKFGEVAYESESQVDFYLLDNSKIDVEFDPPTSLIQSFHLAIRGDKSKIHSLGEKMLPSNLEFLGNNEFSEEDNNEIFRYHKDYFYDDYYYKFVEDQQYALIRVYYSTSDIFGKDEQSDSPTYFLDVTLVSEESVYDAIGISMEDDNEYIETENTVEYYEESEVVSLVTYEELENVVINGGNLEEMDEYLSQYDQTEDISKLLAYSSYLSTERNNYGYNEIADLLIMHGADPNFLDFQGYRPIQHAVFNGNVSLVRLLLNNGSIPDLISPISGISIRDEVNSNGNQELINLLSEY